MSLSEYNFFLYLKADDDIQMVIFAFAMMYSFSWKEYRMMKPTEGKRHTTVWRAFFHSLNYSDFIRDFYNATVFSFRFCLGRPETRGSHEKNHLDINEAFNGNEHEKSNTVLDPSPDLDERDQPQWSQRPNGYPPQPEMSVYNPHAPVSSYQQPATSYHQPPTSFHQPPASYPQQPNSYHQQPNSYHQPSNMTLANHGDARERIEYPSHPQSNQTGQPEDENRRSQYSEYGMAV